mmetsp:Transcript_9899/g.11202  ORF Transcript_9899/g.11202 Transcript_9899/m.11202 type:complete len:159 (+) Transcript_9899:446-922(+)|eukprot:CAMPEP_0205803718 /NCGR_PEP_ID=MMETSP0205-20121125/6449_1 /ASSEMBLY_ACC=CAM_ASM_000278 /TAXON_ID=36767 /ORGANISM="Euplotes focardii, Strain TN1" /LENGTH=158 /DNA_ID=CAMNT_0053072231 /DNA_START=466 /DNA_END=942 /DNA_ORIENTATION=-
MKALKAGEIPKRGNPNNEEDQDLDTNEGNSSKPMRNSNKEETKGDYPNIGPPPDMGLPGGDGESHSSKSNDSSNDSSDDEDEDSDDSPPPKKKEIYKPPPPTKPSKSGKIKKGKEFYKAIEQAKKHARNVISDLGYNKVGSSVKELEMALEILRELED